MSDELKAIKEQGRHISSLRGGYGVSDAIQSLDELVDMVASELSAMKQRAEAAEAENAELTRKLARKYSSFS